MSKRNKKQRKILRISSIIVLIIAIILIIPASRERLFRGSKLFSRSEKELLLIKDLNVGSGIEEIDISYDTIIASKYKSLNFYDFNGAEILKKDFKWKELDIVFGKELIYAMDKSSGKLEILNKEGKRLEKIDLKMPFDRLKEEGENIHIYRKDGDAEYIDTIDRKGSSVNTHEERIPILTLSMRDNGQEYMVSSLEQDERLNSMLDIYSIEGEHLENISLKDRVVVYSQYIGKEILVASGKNIYLLKDGKIKWEKKINNLKDIEARDRKIYLLYDDKFEILNLKGKIKEEFTLSSDLEKIKFIGKDPLLFGKRNIVMPQKKNHILNFETDEDIVDLKYSEGSLLIQKKAKLEIYKIKEKGDI